MFSIQWQHGKLKKLFQLHVKNAPERKVKLEISEGTRATRAREDCVSE